MRLRLLCMEQLSKIAREWLTETLYELPKAENDRCIPQLEDFRRREPVNKIDGGIQARGKIYFVRRSEDAVI